MRQIPEKTRNLLSALAVMAVSTYWFFGGRDFRPLSRLFPQVLAAIVFTLALTLGVLTLLGRGPVIRLASTETGERHLRSGTLMGALVVWTALIPLVGLLFASVIGTVLMGLLTFRAHVGTLKAVVIALISVALFYLLFTSLLNVPFPTGLLG
ncbi:MAG: tripartite tricarboxylate transporter TctB family protein [Alkalispirochaetaceae bacterium]